MLNKKPGEHEMQHLTSDEDLDRYSGINKMILRRENSK